MENFRQNTLKNPGQKDTFIYHCIPGKYKISDSRIPHLPKGSDDPEPVSCIPPDGGVYERFLQLPEPFLQAATHAPQPIQEAASIASSATGFGIGMAFASGTPPVFTDT